MLKNYIVLGAIAVILGLMMLFSPTTFLQVMVIVAGIGLLISGIIALRTSKLLLNDTSFKWPVIIRGIICIIVGLLVVILPLTIATIAWRIMMYVLGAGLLVSAGIEVYTTIKLRQANIPSKMYWIEIIFSIAFAILFFAMPVEIGNLIVRICGAVLVVVAIIFLIWAIKTKKEDNEFQASVKYTVEDADETSSTEQNSSVTKDSSTEKTSSTKKDSE